jgi:ribosomal protein L21
VQPTARTAICNRFFSTSASRWSGQENTPKPKPSSILEKVTLKNADLTPLKLESDLYAVIKVHNNPFLVTKGDKVILPYNLKHAQVGDVLEFYDVTTIGSRNHTFTDTAIDPSLFSIKAIVLEKTKLPMRVTKVTKRRQRKVRHAISKPERTILRVTELKLN